MPGADPRDLAEMHALLDERERRLAQRSFLAFYRRMTGFRPPGHIRVLARLLQSIEEDKLDRAMVFMPPRHAKTLCCSVLFPAWQMGRDPTTKIMCVAHTQEYARTIGGQVRNLFRSPAWPFDVSMAEDTQAKEKFATTAGGVYNGFGMLAGNQQGSPASTLILDDIIRGRAVALSSHMRNIVWDSYRSDILSRLQDRRKQLMIYTRWHMDDPAGRILPENFDGSSGWYRDRETGEPWYVLSMPAVAEHENDPMGRARGEWLWPEMHGEEQLGGMRRRGGWMWSAMYQQRPSPEEGMLFTSEHFQRFNVRGLHTQAMRLYISSDYAVKDESEGGDPNYTVHLVWAVDEDYNVYLVDGWRGRTFSDRWCAEWVRLAKKWKPLQAFEEQGQILRSVGPILIRMMRSERVYVHRVQLHSSQDKVMRAHALLGWASMGKFYLPDRATAPPHLLELLDALETELLQFPTGKHDDTVDAATLFARGLDRLIAGTTPKPPSPHADSLDALWSDADRRRGTHDTW